VSVATFFDESLGEAKRLIEADDVGDAFERFRRKVMSPELKHTPLHRKVFPKPIGSEFSRRCPLNPYIQHQVPILDQALLDFEERWINLESQNPLVSEAVLAGGSGAAAYLAVLSVR
jgi:hypothetical protein